MDAFYTQNAIKKIVERIFQEFQRIIYILTVLYFIYVIQTRNQLYRFNVSLGMNTMYVQYTHCENYPYVAR